MSEHSSRIARALGTLASVVYVAYFLGFTVAGTYFNWTYARDNGFVKWLLLGQVVPTAKAAVWPYFLVVRLTHQDRLDTTIRQPSSSVQNFFFSLDALARANSSDQVGDRPDQTRVLPLLQEAVDSAASVDRGELNRLYPALGDHFLDDGIGTARLYLEAVSLGDRDRMTRAMAAWIRWTNWYNANMSGIVAAMQRSDYQVEVR